MSDISLDVGVAEPRYDRWTVRIAWLPRWPALVRRFGGWRRRDRRGGGPDLDLDPSGLASAVTGPSGRGGGGGGRFDVDDIGAAILLLVLVVVGALLFWWLLLPLLLLVVDLLVVVVLVVAAALARLLFRRPWVVEAVGPGPEATVTRYVREVVGWRRARRVRDEIADALAVGDEGVLAGMRRR